MGSSAGAFSTTSRRRAHHAGSWYSSDPQELDIQLSDNLAQVSEEDESVRNARGLIAPHAGYSYSGPTAAYAYRSLQDAAPSIRTVVVLHPSHHVWLDGCALSRMYELSVFSFCEYIIISHYLCYYWIILVLTWLCALNSFYFACTPLGATVLETPLGNLEVDEDLRNELLATENFSVMTLKEDEEEHSGEMQYPYIAKVAPHVKVLPIMVGSISTALESKIGALLAPFLARSHIFTAVSSDFCHWGSRFGYTPTGEPTKHIFEHIEWLDRTGMDHISLQDPGAFATYLKQYSNTICGRHPIAVWLHAVKVNKEVGREKVEISFVRYAQSSQVKSKRDSSVSYASAVARISS
uniref:Protein MEMO1 n=1 Tax=Attheya septentrionalis TaxID=420275 RepID=A0A7S2XRP3_9STRA|mmetsp:Transcript_29691/g.54382  ORF Transcript_29691/g.54382 Transcript_29691/m.54382 type:complete len:352 (+) Transcript_29691:140-1195(+)